VGFAGLNFDSMTSIIGSENTLLLTFHTSWWDIFDGGDFALSVQIGPTDIQASVKP